MTALAAVPPAETSAVDRGAIYRAMPAIMKEVGAVEKGRRNAQQGYNFRGIDEVYQACQLVLAKHGVFVVPFIVEREREERVSKSGGATFSVRLLIDHRFYAEDGSSVVARTLGEAMDSGDKASNKAMSAAMKYALVEALCIPTADPKDTEEESPEVEPRAGVQAKKPPQAQANDRERPWMEDLQQAMVPLKLGVAGADEKALKGKARTDYIKGYWLMWLTWAVGREINSPLELTEAEAAKAIEKAKNGEVPAAEREEPKA